MISTTTPISSYYAASPLQATSEQQLPAQKYYFYLSYSGRFSVSRCDYLDLVWWPEIIKNSPVFLSEKDAQECRDRLNATIDKEMVEQAKKLKHTRTDLPNLASHCAKLLDSGF